MTYPQRATPLRNTTLPVVLLLSLVASGCHRSTEAPAKPDTPTGPEAASGREPSVVVTTAWKKAGANYGGAKATEFGSLVHSPCDPPGSPEPREYPPADDEIPSFHFRELPTTPFARLPAIEVPFGLLLQTMTDADLKGLAQQKHLKLLDLSRTKVTDTGVRELAGLPRLQMLNLAVTPTTDASLKVAAGLPELRMLNLISTKVTDAGLKELRDVKNLRTLNLGGTSVTDAGLKELTALQNLETLELSGTKVTDASMKVLAGFSQLQGLYLNYLPVTDAGLKELTALKQLRTLGLRDTKATDAGIARLREALPNLKVLPMD